MSKIFLKSGLEKMGQRLKYINMLGLELPDLANCMGHSKNCPLLIYNSSLMEYLVLYLFTLVSTVGLYLKEMSRDKNIPGRSLQQSYRLVKD